MIIDLNSAKARRRTEWKRTSVMHRDPSQLTFSDFALGLPLLFFSGMLVGIGIMLAIASN